MIKVEHLVDRYYVEVETIEHGDFMTRQTWFKRDEARDLEIIHNKYGPAVICYEPYSGNVIEERWYDMGKASRIDGPAITKYDPVSQTVVEEIYLADGDMHRIGGPAHIIRESETGNVIHQKYYRFGQTYLLDPEDNTPTI